MLALHLQDRHSRRSFSLTNFYENIRFGFDYRGDDCRIRGLPGPEEGGGAAYFHFNHDPRRVDYQEELDREEDVDLGFGRSFASREEDDQEEGRSVSFSKRISFAVSDSLIGVAIRNQKRRTRSHTAKLSPHEQWATAFGFVTLNPPFCRSSL
jgi:hypothetical protein